MDSFLHEKNLELLQRQLTESDPTKNPQRHNMLLRLLAEEEAKRQEGALDSYTFAERTNGPPRYVRICSGHSGMPAPD